MTKKLILLIASITLLFSCTVDEDLKPPEDQSGKVLFSFTNLSTDEDSIENAKNLVDPIPKSIYINITDATGVSVVDNQKLNLIVFGNGYITNELELPVGNYEITTFNVLDANDSVIYACPRANSEYSEYVDNPLPIAFSVTDGNTTNVSPEVVFVDETNTPEQFGFTTFSFTIVDITDPVDPINEETQELYISITEITNGIANEVVDGNFYIEIPSEDFYLDGRIFVDHIPITIPISKEDDVKVTVIYDGYESQIFYFDADLISTYSEIVPFEVYFQEETPIDTTQYLYVSLYQYDGEAYLTSGAYTLNINNQGYSDEAALGYNDINTIELPMISNNETVDIKFYHSAYQIPILVNLTREQVLATSSEPLEVYFGETPEETPNYDTQRLYVKVLKREDDGTTSYPTSFYDAEIGNLGFYKEGYLPAGYDTPIYLPTESYNELTLTIRYEGGTQSISMTQEEAQQYVSSTLLIYL